MNTLNFNKDTNKTNEQDKKESLIENMQQGCVQATNEKEGHDPTGLKNIASSGKFMQK